MSSRALRACLRDPLASLLYRSGLTRPERARDGLTVVTFHRVLPAEQRAVYPLPGLAVTPERLAWLLGYFKRHFTCAPLAEAADAWRGGERRSLPWLAVTFDDALGDNPRHAAPVLARFGVRATFFVPCEAVERGDLLWHDRLGWALQRGFVEAPSKVRNVLEELGIARVTELAPEASPVQTAVQAAKQLAPTARAALVRRIESLCAGSVVPDWEGMASWQALRELRRRTHEIGSHSMTHPLLPQCDEAGLEYEIAGSKRLLEERLDGPVLSFCYPNGDFDDRTVRRVADSGYRWAVTTLQGRNAPGAMPFTLRRCDLVQEHVERRDGTPSESLLAWRLSGLRAGGG